MFMKRHPTMETAITIVVETTKISLLKLAKRRSCRSTNSLVVDDALHEARQAAKQHAENDASEAVADHGVAYLPVAAMSSQLDRLLSLYGLLETRSPVNSVMPLLNPLSAPASMTGVVRPAYRDLHRDAAEATPFRLSPLLRLVDGKAQDILMPAELEPQAYPPTGMTSLEYWHAA
ncbi:MAG: glycosyltransferase [Microvirga sp.]|nr:glycosyltransferase [Microvirga sp.]